MRFWSIVLVRSFLTAFLLIFVVSLSQQWPHEPDGILAFFGGVCFLTVLAWSVPVTGERNQDGGSVR